VEDPPRVDGVVPGAGTVQRSKKAQAQAQHRCSECSEKGAGTGASGKSTVQCSAAQRLRRMSGLFV